MAQFNYLLGQNGAVTFTSHSTNATTLAWDYGDGSNDSGSPVMHTYTTNGTFTVTLTATGDGGISTVSQSVTITNANVGSFTFNGGQFGGPTTSSNALGNFVWITDANNNNMQLWIEYIPIGSNGSSNIYDFNTGFTNNELFVTVYTNGIDINGAYYSLNGGTLIKTGANSFTLSCVVSTYPVSGPSFSVTASGTYPPF